MKPFTQARKYMSALISDLPRKNGWTIAEHAGDLTQDPTQRLLNHAGAAIYVPEDQITDPDRRALGIPQKVAFKTKPQLAQDILADAIADETMPPWVAGDEVYGRSGPLRADAVVARYLYSRKQQSKRREICSVTGPKGECAYAWAWVATTSSRHFLLIHMHFATGERAYHYCYVPLERPVTLMMLVRVACLRWPVEEGFEFGKDHFGLGHSQVRLYTALLRHILLTMAALAVSAVTAASARTPHASPDSAHHT